MSPEDFMQSVQRKMYLSNDPRFKEFLDSYGAFDWGSSEDYNRSALIGDSQGQYGRVSDEDDMGLGEPIALPNRQSATPTNEREWEQISGNPKFNDFDWGSSQDYLSYSKRGGERDMQPMTSSQNLAINQEIKDAGEEIDGSQYSGEGEASGGGTNYSGIGGAIKDSAEAISDGLDSLGNFKRNLMTGGLSILSSIIPDTPRKLRAERRAVGGDSYGRRQYNNMFKDGGTLTRAERYLQKNYKKLDGNKDRKEFLESLINLKTK